jgi:hypothetical protein
MARHFVKQPDGKIAIWSTVVNSFLKFNLTPEQAIEQEKIYEQDSDYPGGIECLEIDCKDELENIKETGRAYPDAYNWDEALEDMREFLSKEAPKLVIAEKIDRRAKEVKLK